MSRYTLSLDQICISNRFISDLYITFNVLVCLYNNNNFSPFKPKKMFVYDCLLKMHVNIQLEPINNFPCIRIKMLFLTIDDPVDDL